MFGVAATATAAEAAAAAATVATVAARVAGAGREKRSSTVAQLLCLGGGGGDTAPTAFVTAILAASPWIAHTRTAIRADVSVLLCPKAVYAWVYVTLPPTPRLLRGRRTCRSRRRTW